MQKSFIILTFLLSTSFLSRAQYLNYDIIEAMEYFRTNQMTTEQPPSVLTEEHIEGSPYLNDEFVSGTIYTASKQKVIDIPLRYNIFNDDLEFKTPDNKVLAIARPETVERAEFGETTLVFQACKYGNVSKSGFFRVVTEGKVTLLAKANVIFQKATQEAAYKEARPPRFTREPDTFYLKTDNDAAVRIKNKKDLANYFTDHKKEMETFIKRNRVKVSKQTDLLKVIEYYHSL